MTVVENSNSGSNAVFYVCRLCLRLYTLSEDLRGHMIGFHGFRPHINPNEKENKQPTTSSEIATVAAATAAIETIGQQQSAIDGVAELGIAPEMAEMRPLPFKSFRLLLRSKLTLRCDISNLCGYKFEDAEKLELHKRCHSGAVDQTDTLSFKCFECATILPNWRQCSMHLWKIHQIDVDLLHCPVCLTFKAHTTVHAWRHMRVHKKWRPLVLRTLRAIQKRRERKQLPPAIVPATVAINKNKYYAEKICEICGRKFVNGKTLSKHVKTVHSKIKPFICNICGAKTARKASLNIHMRQHTGEKPLHCTTCKFSTRDPSVLKKHQQRHSKKGLFKCSDCSYNCIQAISLKRHIRLKHPASFQKISCELCSFTSTNENTLIMHKEDHRRGLIHNPDDSMDATRCEIKNQRKLLDKNSEMSADCFLPLESIDSLPHEPAVDTGGVTIPAPPSEDTQFATYLNN